MRKILLLAVLALAVMAAPAFASVQNVKVSGDVEAIWLVRDQFDLGSTLQTNQFYQNMGITQAQLRVDADLTDNVSATIRLLNERVWGSGSYVAATDGPSGDSDDTGVDINLAYITLREMLYSPLTVVIGRQDFAFGNSFVIDSAGVNNIITNSGGLANAAQDLSKRTAMDAVRMIFDYNPLTIDLVAAKVNSNGVNGITDTSGGQRDDVDLFGINANYQLGDDMNTVIESYFWAKIDNSTAETGLWYKEDSVYMPGMRASANILDGLNVSGEVAWQRGTKVLTSAVAADPQRDAIAREAMGAQLIANYKVPFEQTKEWSPVLTSAYTYVSGDSGPNDGKDPSYDKEHYTGWDPMFENQAGGTIYNSLFDLTNAHIVTVRGQVNPMEDLAAIFEWSGLWLDKSIKDVGATADNGESIVTMVMRQPDGRILSGVPMTSNKDLGNEFDMKLVYDYTEDVQIGAMYGMFLPGNAFRDTTQMASQFMVNAKVDF